MKISNEKTLIMEKCIHLTWQGFNRRKKIVLYKNNLNTSSWLMLFTLHNYSAIVYAFPLRKDFLIPVFVVLKGKLLAKLLNCKKDRKKYILISLRINLVLGIQNNNVHKLKKILNRKTKQTSSLTMHGGIFIQN